MGIMALILEWDWREWVGKAWTSLVDVDIFIARRGKLFIMSGYWEAPLQKWNGEGGGNWKKGENEYGRAV